MWYQRVMFNSLVYNVVSLTTHRDNCIECISRAIYTERSDLNYYRKIEISPPVLQLLVVMTKKKEHRSKEIFSH